MAADSKKKGISDDGFDMNAKQVTFRCVVCGKPMNKVYAWIPCPKCEGKPVCLSHCYCVCGVFNQSDCPDDADPVGNWAAGRLLHEEVQY